MRYWGKPAITIGLPAVLLAQLCYKPEDTAPQTARRNAKAV